MRFVEQPWTGKLLVRPDSKSRREFCAAIGKKSNKPLKEIIKLRTSRELHRRLALYADEQGLTTDAVINNAVERYLAHAERALTPSQAPLEAC